MKPKDIRIVCWAMVHLFVIAPANIFFCVAKVLHKEAKAAIAEVNKILSEPDEY